MKSKVYRNMIIGMMLATSISSGMAQTGSLDVYDLTMTAKLKYIPDLPDSGMIDTSLVSDSVLVKVYFKLSDPTVTSRVNLLLGSAKDVGDVSTGQYQATMQGNDCYLSVNGTPEKVWGNSCIISYELSGTEFSNINWVTVYAEDSGGNLTQRKYYQK